MKGIISHMILIYHQNQLFNRHKILKKILIDNLELVLIKQLILPRFKKKTKFINLKNP